MDEFSYQPQLLQTILGQPHHNTILITKKKCTFKTTYNIINIGRFSLHLTNFIEWS